MHVAVKVIQPQLLYVTPVNRREQKH